MTELSQTILSKHLVRKSKAQKEAFADLLRQHFPNLRTETSKFPLTQNLILGDVQSAKVLFGAHYDTCARMPIPNFIAPLNPILSIAYSLVLLIPIGIILFVFNLLLSWITTDFTTHYLLSLVLCFGLLALLMIGPANTTTVNDNTSGVITLLEIYQSLSEEEKKQAAFIFFDNEEKGLLGSAAFRKQHKKAVNSKLLINLDCVSNGDHFLVAVSKKARGSHEGAITEAFATEEGKELLVRKLEKVYYPSDQAGFPMGVAVAALKHKKGIGYYMDRIHTKRDTVMDERNIAYLANAAKKLINVM